MISCRVGIVRTTPASRALVRDVKIIPWRRDLLVAAIPLMIGATSSFSSTTKRHSTLLADMPRLPFAHAETWPYCLRT